MGVITPTKPDPVTEAALSRALNDELADKGFVVAQLDKLITWARTGSMWGLTFGLACTSTASASRRCRARARPTS